MELEGLVVGKGGCGDWSFEEVVRWRLVGWIFLVRDEGKGTLSVSASGLVDRCLWWFCFYNCLPFLRLVLLSWKG